MSYILEALKKSEQDRGNGAVPSVQSIHSSSINYHHTSSSIWPWIIGIVLIVNALALAYFFVSKSPADKDSGTGVHVIPQNTSNLSGDFVAHTPPEQLTSPANIIDTPKKESVPVESLHETIPVEKNRDNHTYFEKTQKKQPQVESNIANYSKSIARNKTQTTRPSSIKKEPIDFHAEVLNIHDLPENIKHQIPEMTFSAHVYSSNPLQRSLVINGKFMEEGEQLNDNLTLSEITTRGAIFTFKEYRFSTSVIAGWN